MKYDLFVSDFDGTLGYPDMSVSSQNIEAIREFEKRGGKFVLCTGRMYASAKRICEMHGFKGLVISYQGACIHEIETGRRLLNGGLDYNAAAEIVGRLKKDDCMAVVNLDGGMYCEKENIYTDYHKQFLQVQVVDDLIKLLYDKKETVSKVVGVDIPERVAELRQKYSAEYDPAKFTFNSGGEHLLEIINPAYSKGNAVEFVAKYYNMPYEKIIAIGDSTNDKELLGGAWYGVAVGDGAEELKKVADEVTVPFADNPVCEIIKKHCLNG